MIPLNCTCRHVECMQLSIQCGICSEHCIGEDATLMFGDILYLLVFTPYHTGACMWAFLNLNFESSRNSKCSTAPSQSYGDYCCGLSRGDKVDGPLASLYLKLIIDVKIAISLRKLPYMSCSMMSVWHNYLESVFSSLIVRAGIQTFSLNHEPFCYSPT